MQVKRVRITSAYLDSYWYADKIGQEVCILGIGYGTERQRYEVIQTGTYAMRPIPHYIDEGDFEVLDVFDAEVIEQVTISIHPRNRNIQDFDNE